MTRRRRDGFDAGAAGATQACDDKTIVRRQLPAIEGKQRRRERTLFLFLASPLRPLPLVQYPLVQYPLVKLYLGKLVNNQISATHFASSVFQSLFVLPQSD